MRLLNNFNFDLFYPKFLNRISKISNIIYTLIKNILTTIAIPINLAFVLAVEVPRVQAGIETFDENPTHALGGAVVIVLTQMVLEFLIHNIEEANNWHEKEQYRWTLKSLTDSISYFFGIGKIEKEKYRRSPSIYYKMASNLNAAGILVLSIIGSLSSQIGAVSGQIDATTNQKIPWNIGLEKLFLTSDLKTFTAVIGGLIMAVVLVTISTRYSRYVAIQASVAFKEIEETSKAIINQQIAERFMSLKQFINKIKSRVLKELDLTSFNDDDKIEFIDDNLIVLHNSRTGFTSNEFVLNNANSRNKFVNYLKEEIEARK